MPESANGGDSIIETKKKLKLKNFYNFQNDILVLYIVKTNGKFFLF